MNYLILITGLPATGKTSFARYLSRKMEIPMASKDIIKEHLFDTVGFKNRNEKVALGIAAMDIMYHFAEIQLELGKPVILENNFENISRPGLLKIIEKYNCKTITIRFHADMQILSERFLVRDRSPERHRGHVINTRYPEDKDPVLIEIQPINIDKYYSAMKQRGMEDFSVGGMEITVDSTDFSKVSYNAIYEEIKMVVDSNP